MLGLRCAPSSVSIIAVIVLSAPPGWASEDESRFRLGLVVGAPVALAAAFEVASDLVTHVNVSPPSDHTRLGVRFDLVYRFSELGGEVGGLARAAFWVGPGLRWTFEEEHRSYVGGRVPFGLSLFVGGGEAEIYAEIAPALVLHPERSALLEAGLGLRFGLF